MGRTAWGAWSSAAVALTACCLAVAASVQQASASPAPSGSTAPAVFERPAPVAAGQAPAAGQAQTATRQPPGEAEADPEASLPTSVDKVRDGLAREPVIRLTTQPIFRVDINERRPRYWDLEAPFLFPVEPRTSTTRWHDEFLAMTTPDEVRAFSGLNSGSAETLQLAATSLLFAGAVKLVQSGFAKWQDGRREGKVRAAREEVDAAIAAWEAANPPTAAPR
jgi:hypothetical protein